MQSLDPNPMTTKQERKLIAQLETQGWSRQYGISGSYWIHNDGRCFGGGRPDEILALSQTGTST